LPFGALSLLQVVHVLLDRQVEQVGFARDVGSVQDVELDLPERRHHHLHVGPTASSPFLMSPTRRMSTPWLA
jgi:sporulation protein YlmC with PRC-barrel domain